MACNCDNYVCLEPVRQYDNCREVVTVQLGAAATTTYTWEYEFNGRWKGGSIDVTSGENIVLPWVFNEHYRHTIKIYDENGDLFNDTCYTFDTSKVAGSYATSSGGGFTNYLNVTLTEEMLSDDGTTVTIPAIAGRTIILIADGNQIYNFASFTQDGNSFTMTNGNSFYAGQKITLQFA